MRRTLAAKVSTDKAKHVDKVIAAQFELLSSNSLYRYAQKATINAKHLIILVKLRE